MTKKEKEMTTLEKIQDKVYEIYKNDRDIKDYTFQSEQLESQINSIRKQIAETSKQYGERLSKLDEKVPFLKSMLKTLWDQRNQLKNDLEDLEYEFDHGGDL